jgi:site-specific DNA-methyltransferase (adenine-specific)
VARKPIEGTVATNVLKHGTGALNIDGARIPTGDSLGGGMENGTSTVSEGWDRPWRTNLETIERNKLDTKKKIAKAETLGRWPANIIHDGSDEVVSLFPQSDSCMSPSSADCEGVIFGGSRTQGNLPMDSGSASRFFYTAKASREERSRNMQDVEEQITDDGRNTPIDNPYLRGKTLRSNTHPTVKPLDLMAYLCKLLCPPSGGILLDPFMGSGSTIIAGRRFYQHCIGIELEEKYAEIAAKRLSQEVLSFE